jgi:hypothetical protein
MKLPSALRNLELGRDHAILMPVRFETLSHPLYRDNLMDALAALPGNVGTRLVCNLVVDRTSPPPRLDAMTKGLKKFSKGVLIHSKHPFRGLDRAKESGIEGLVISANAFDFDGGQESMEALINRARKLKLFVTLIGAAGELIVPQKMNVPYFWADK